MKTEPLSPQNMRTKARSLLPGEWPAAKTILMGSQKDDFVILTEGKDLVTN